MADCVGGRPGGRVGEGREDARPAKTRWQAPDALHGHTSLWIALLQGKTTEKGCPAHGYPRTRVRRSRSAHPWVRPGSGHGQVWSRHTPTCGGRAASVGGDYRPGWAGRARPAPGALVSRAGTSFYPAAGESVLSSHPAVEDDQVEVEVWVQGRSEAVQETDRAELRVGGRPGTCVAKRGSDGA
jgi:hypothetical protein